MRDDHDATGNWRWGLALALALFTAVPVCDGAIACGAGVLVLFVGLLLFYVVADVDEEVPQRRRR